MNYTHLSPEERYQIHALIQAQLSFHQIAMTLCRQVSTLSREVRRNRGQRGYRPKPAQRLALARVAHNASTIPKTLWGVVIKKLRIKWRPEQIAGTMGTLSHTSIYRYLHRDKQAGGQLYRLLRHQLKSYRKNKLHETRGLIKGLISIHQRPIVVEQRTRLGDWEADTIIGKHHQQALVTLVERQSGLVKIKKVTRKTAQQVTQAIYDLLKPISAKVKTITSDNGKEFAQHAKVAQLLSADFYFADPYASWQRGSNENTNGLIREYLPK